MEKKTLILIFVLAVILRIVALDRNPISLFGDELDVGYHAYSLLKTGKDYTGHFLPTYIQSLNEARAPLQMYLTIPFVAFFGLNEWGVRLPPALFGSFSVISLYFLVKITNNHPETSHFPNLTPLISAAALAISPWHIQYSRAAFEVALLIFLLITATLLFFMGLKHFKIMLLSIILYGLSFYTYNTALVFTPLLVIYLLVKHQKELDLFSKTQKSISIGLSIALLLPISYHIFFGSASTRFSQNSIFTSQETLKKVNIQINSHQLSKVYRTFHNRPLSWLRVFVSNYFISFSPQFLFIDGDPVYRHSIHEMGQLYWIQLPLILLGLVHAIRRPKDHRLWLVWLVISPIPASLTSDAAHATRLFLTLPPLIFFSAIGVSLIIQTVKYRNLIIFTIAALTTLNFSVYQERYWLHYKEDSWRWWHQGFKEPLTYIKNHLNDYDRIFINNTYEPSLIRFLFWTAYDPEVFQKSFLSDEPRRNIIEGFNGFSLNNLYFGTVQDKSNPADLISINDLYMVSQRDEVGGDWDWRKTPPSNTKVLLTTTNPSGEPIFYLISKR